MTTNYTELKRLAEDAKPQWYGSMTNKVNFYIAAASPDTVLALIADLERAEAEVKRMREQEPVAWMYVPSDVWADVILTQDIEKIELARQYGRNVEPLYAAPVAQQGWKLVPVEPTQEMCQAGLDSGKNKAWSYAKCYQAMLAAAPEAV